MKAVVWHGLADIRLDDVPEPKIKDPYDAIVRITTSAVCGTDLHFVRGTMPGMQEGRILGHEAVGVGEEVGSGVRNFRPGDRVVVPSTVACGTCSYCRAGYYAQCDNANPQGPQAGTTFFGGPEAAGGLDMAYNNAGIQIPPSDAADEPAERFDRVNAINLRGVWACMKHELRHTRPQGSGAIVNCSSLGGLVGLPGHASTTPPNTE